MKTTPGNHLVLCLCLAAVLLPGVATGQQPEPAEAPTPAENPAADSALQLFYLEIVTPSVDETCATLEQASGLEFGEPIPEFGGARTAELSGGGLIGVRGPLRETEVPVVRPYVLVDDIHAAVQAAEKRGAHIALPPMEMPGRGMFAVYLLGGNEHGLWQN